ncbi:hypothetical protein M758_1G243700 [Ceratodon purpureus]|uniref:Uncharacterized protein n=1 Tax=Ceratodon purpureus TaxID=3225 RepID=A0A8T0JBD9_CERPU|nr:hypothetical protein KC19_1G249400 [Ceratodon purpureus]KAG0631319.1 hypothetical protein M758_1G243700 [Ceratodon purpureus]
MTQQSLSNDIHDRTQTLFPMGYTIPGMVSHILSLLKFTIKYILATEMRKSGALQHREYIILMHSTRNIFLYLYIIYIHYQACKDLDECLELRLRINPPHRFWHHCVRTLQNVP